MEANPKFQVDRGPAVEEAPAAEPPLAPLLVSEVLPLVTLAGSLFWFHASAAAADLAAHAPLGLAASLELAEA